MLASAGQASAVGRLSVPPSWAGEATSASSGTPARLAGAGWTAAAPDSAPVATVPAGMPSVASAGKTTGFGAPRYGVKPTVVPRAAVG
ncbi:PE/PPE C-terminal domain-containing protein [Mycobacterium heckeshornense]|uniref:PE/PPE C-terminal domain-containing protein n=1 Tax=Mycobacterium heckeshornense TaxID=110505 RepID=UPI001F1D92F7|nr:PE/PPE C-terminal domain-containing protein [Mycobacterium heckeshornense]